MAPYVPLVASQEWHLTYHFCVTRVAPYVLLVAPHEWHFTCYLYHMSGTLRATYYVTWVAPYVLLIASHYVPLVASHELHRTCYLLLCYPATPPLILIPMTARLTTTKCDLARHTGNSQPHEKQTINEKTSRWQNLVTLILSLSLIITTEHPLCFTANRNIQTERAPATHADRHVGDLTSYDCTTVRGKLILSRCMFSMDC